MKLKLSKKARLRLTWTLSALLLLLFSGYLLRNVILHALLERQISAAEAKTGFVIRVEESRLKGLKSLHLTGIEVLKNQDTLAQLEILDLDLSIWGFITGKQLISSLEMRNGSLRKAKNYLPKNQKNRDRLDSEPTDLSALPIRAYSLFKKYFPAEVNLYNLTIQYRDSSGMIQLKLDSLLTLDKDFIGSAQISDGQTEQTWKITGDLKEGIRLSCYPINVGILPILYARTSAELQLDSLYFFLHTTESSKGNFSFHADAKLEGLKLFHSKISADTISFPFLRTRTKWHIANGFIELDSNSTFTCEHVQGNYSLLVSLNKSNPVYGVSVKTHSIAADSFFASLPGGAFDETRNLKAKGKLSYHLKFLMDGKKADELVFESGFKKENFSILSYPKTPLSLMNGPFEHTVYENGKLARKFLVGEENPNFTSISKVPLHLIEAILCSEDPSFFVHRGFIQEAFRESIIENYKSKSFKRGGSTISMQLVKNVFLSRKKTVFRKIEEALIVWLIENQRLSSKERMMEVYLNIIEWGPNVYGIKEASKYYFDKEVEDLNLSECIYLATIIPRPKKFAWAFQDDGSMKSYLREQHLFLMRRMAQKEYLTESDTSGYQIDLKITGRAKELIQPEAFQDSIPEEIPGILELIPKLD